jgi:glycosyltransferase involved in cell wall biosynthesis
MKSPMDKPPLVVQVAPYFPPHIGGMENVAKAIAEGLAERGPVTVLSSRSGASGAARRERHGNLLVRRLFTVEAAHVPFMPSLLIHLLRLPRSAIVHVHVAVAYPPEMVWLACLLRRRSYVAHYHLDVEPSGPLGFLFVAYKRWVLGGVLRSAATVLALSDQQAVFLQGRYGVDEDRILVMPNAVGAEFIREPPAAPAHDGPFRLLFVGRLAPQKNVSLLLRAMAVVQAAVELVIVGDGEQATLLRRLTEELGLTNVRMVGPQWGDDLVAWYRWADAFVLTSEKEGMPLVLLEAMAGGIPVVSTAVPGIAETLGDSGLMSASDPDAFAAAVDRIASDPVLWADLARRSYTRGTQFAGSVALTTLKDVYEGIRA